MGSAQFGLKRCAGGWYTGWSAYPHYYPTMHYQDDAVTGTNKAIDSWVTWRFAQPEPVDMKQLLRAIA